MNRLSYYFMGVCVLAAAAASCQKNRILPEPAQRTPLLHASTEAVVYLPSTKVSLDSSMKVLWNADDRVSIFDRYTYNMEYAFAGEDGANAGDFKILDNGEFHTGNELDHIYAVFPHDPATTISNSGIINASIAGEQEYLANSFGGKTNLMVSVTDTDKLLFRNAGSFIEIRVHGTDAKVSSVLIRSLGGEPLSGPVSVMMTPGGAPALKTLAGAADSVKVVCPEPVEVSSDPENPTSFIAVVIPGTLSQGFTAIVTGPDGTTVEKTITGETDLLRNTMCGFAAVKMPATGEPVDPQQPEEPTGDETKPWIASLFFGGSLTHRLERDASDTLSYLLTVPAMTDFSAVPMSAELPEGVTLYHNGAEVDAAAFAVDASSVATLTVKSASGARTDYTLRARNTGLPVVFVTTPGTVNSKEDWMEGASMRIENADGTVDYEGTMSIKGRGNVTWSYPKKPYALKLDKKASILGMPKHKRWILMSNWRDRTLLRNVAAFWLSNHTESLPYATRGQFVELVYNGQFMGNYYLCEQIKIDENRVNVPEQIDGDTVDETIWTNGFLMEVDPYDQSGARWSNEWGSYGGWSAATPKFITNLHHIPVNFKEPDEDVISQKQYDYMKWYYNYVEELLAEKTSGPAETVYAADKVSIDASKGKGFNTGVKLFDGSFPGGFRITFDLLVDLSVTPGDQATFMTCMNETGSPWPGFVFRYDWQTKNFDFGMNPNGFSRNNIAIKASNHVVLEYDGSLFKYEINGIKGQANVNAPVFDWPLVLGGSLKSYDASTGSVTWMRAATCEFRDLKVEKLGGGESTHTWVQWLDPETMIDYMLVNELATNKDIYNSWPNFGPSQGNYPYSHSPHSMYMYKDGPLLKFGPVWDFDYKGFTPEYANRLIAIDSMPWYAAALKDPIYKARLIEKWNAEKGAMLGLEAYIDEMAGKLALSESFNHEMWPIQATPYVSQSDAAANGDESMSYDAAITRMKQAFRTKWEYLDRWINSLK